MEKTKSYDLVVIGTGFHGLSVAKTYLQVNPDASVQLYDIGPTPGGVWSADRLYPGLKTNNHVGSYEFGDFPMPDAGLEKGKAIPAIYVHTYLRDYANHFDLVRRTQFNTMVETVEQQGTNGWLLTIRAKVDSLDIFSRAFASKLVVATGTTSAPSMPILPGQDDFNAPLFHSKEFAVRAEGLKGSESVVVFGGAKSAWDVANSYASKGVQVDWVIRDSGHGPCWMLPRTVLGPLKIISGNFIHVRLVSWFSPCIYGEADGFRLVRRLLNQTWLGVKLIKEFWKLMQINTEKANGYAMHPETMKLKPRYESFWAGANRGVLNYDANIFQMVREGKIRVHIADIIHLSDHAVHLSDSTVLRTNALICCTGWKYTPAIRFLRDGQDIAAELGIPHYSTAPISPLVQKADAEILARFPRLKEQPAAIGPIQSLPTRSTPAVGPPNVGYRLYRFMVPAAQIHNRNIAFAGVIRSGSTPWLAQAQALWITAFLDGALPHLHPTPSNNNNKDIDTTTLDHQIQYETLLHSRFGFWRYPKAFGGDSFPDFFFDSIPYVDMCLGELGLRFRRKAALWREVFEPYGPWDYKGLTEEWVAKEAVLRQLRELRSKGEGGGGGIVKASMGGSAGRVGKEDGRTGFAWPKAVLMLCSSNSFVGEGVAGLVANVACLTLLVGVVLSLVVAMV